MATLPDTNGYVIEVRRKKRTGQTGKKGFAREISGFREDGKTRVDYIKYESTETPHVYKINEAERIACLAYQTTTRPIRIKIRRVDKSGEIIPKLGPIMTLEREVEIRRREY